MKLRSRLSMDREAPGTFWVEDAAGAILYGPVRARGEADNANAAAQDNVVEDPTRVGGDHPAGLYRVTEVVTIETSDMPRLHTYGPYFLRLDPQTGEAFRAKQQGREGIGIHGGAAGPGNTLRATFGCLRLDSASIEVVAQLVEQEFIQQFIVLYEATVEPLAVV